ncbi:MAG: PAS domain S-box protein [Proteobacteria bacterium]|nr:PAS domain S-box protein [Pseudomonadota bacterium]
MITPKKLIWQIFPANVLTILLVIITVSWYGVFSLQEFSLQDTEVGLESRAQLISSKVKDYLRDHRVGDLREYCVQAGRSSGTRITVILPQGKVLADSNEDPDSMENHSRRIEIAEALAGRVGVSRRFSKTLKENLIYVAIPLSDIMAGGSLENPEKKVEAVLRTSVSVASLDTTLKRIKVQILLGSLAVLLLAGAVTLLISRNVSRPLEQMTKSAELFAGGDFSLRMLPVVKKTASLEVVTLASSMDRMAELLNEKIEAIITQRNQLETVFSSMVEAVIAIDKEERILSINDAAADLFGVDRKGATGKIVQQIIRNVQLQQHISRTLAARESVVDEIILQDESGDRFLHTNVVILGNAAGENIGVLVVMNDVTKIRRLENVRRDFVANVSHELRTPITSIRGYVETLLDGALDIREDAVRFLEIVLHQSERLATIIDDLLALSKIEEEAKRGAIPLATGPLRPVLEAAAQTCRLQADQAGITIIIDCPEQVMAEMNATLLEQAVVNLVANAITYSRKGSEVTVEVTVGQAELAGKVHIVVRDNGIGIAKEHLPRLFERFYRSDKARSRAHGGSGLGLAIVKHIAEAHDGAVEVKSEEGKGSEFSLIVTGKRVGEAPGSQGCGGDSFSDLAET